MTKEERLICSKCKQRFHNVDFKYCPYDGAKIDWKMIEVSEN